MRKIGIFLLAIFIIFLGISGRGCPKRSSDRKVGSSGMPEWSLPAPTNLTATAVSFSQIDLSWIGSLGADGYEIERSLTPATGYSLLATVGLDTTPYSDTTVLGGVTYYYQVRAMNTIGDRSAWSNETSATTPILDAPSSLTATAISFYQVDLSWTDNSDEESGFEIERSTDGLNYTLVATVSADTTFYSDTQASPGLTNYYRIRAFVNIGNYSGYSNVVSALTFNWAWIPTTWTAIAAGGNHSLALTSNGNLWSWGYNYLGQLGLGDSNNRLVPIFIASDFYYNIFEDVDSDAGGLDHTLARKTNGTIWGWGYNEYGQLGLGYTEIPEAPDQIGTDSDWSGISAGGYHSLGLKSTGRLWGLERVWSIRAG